MAGPGGSPARIKIGLVGGGEGGAALFDLLLGWRLGTLTVVVESYRVRFVLAKPFIASHVLGLVAQTLGGTSGG